MVPEIRVLHGGDIAREVAQGLVSCLASRARPTRVFEMADYLTSGFDLVDVSEAPETSPETTSHAYVLVVETAEFENPADGAVTLLRDPVARFHSAVSTVLHRMNFSLQPLGLPRRARWNTGGDAERGGGRRRRLLGRGGRGRAGRRHGRRPHVLLHGLRREHARLRQRGHVR